MNNETREQKLAELFHDIYETLAPAYGYETREDTKQFDPESKNGKLMIAVCKHVMASHTEALVERLEKKRKQHSLGCLSTVGDIEYCDCDAPVYNKSLDDAIAIVKGLHV